MQRPSTFVACRPGAAHQAKASTRTTNAATCSAPDLARFKTSTTAGGTWRSPSKTMRRGLKENQTSDSYYALGS